MPDARLILLAIFPATMMSLSATIPSRHVTKKAFASVRVCAEPYDGVRTEGVLHFVATALRDTVPVGNRMFGQRAEISQMGGIAEGVTSVTSALMVPWGFDDDCSPIPWTGSWVWSPTGEVGFFRGRLRPKANWIDNRPVMDIHAAVWEGFPNSPWEHPMQGGQPALSASELFALYQLLPTLADVAERPYGAISDVVDWRRNAGEIVDRYPARAILESAFHIAEVARIRKSPIPFAGTYRVELENDGEILSTFFLRTGEGATAPFGHSAGMEANEVRAAPMPTGAYVAPATLALSAGALNATASPEEPTECARLMGLYAAEAETGTANAVRAWMAELPLVNVSTCFGGSEYLKELQSVQGPTPEVGLAGPDLFTGMFRQEGDGRFTFRQPAALNDGVLVYLVGERIGLKTLPAVSPTNRLGP